ncbi:DegV family protein [Paenibacillus sp. YYML68]|uniref:DegV family protein n=1 Tax=Paenibacillus sp. YYML68 TaxID=2909250 RepID=UPI0024919D15|nr:DegV family protein [Paenibacillus sp. YYML68]
MAIRLITDGGVDFPSSWTEQQSFQVVPLHVTFDDLPYDVGQGMRSFYDKMKAHKNLPKTASPSPGDFVQAMEKHPDDDLIVVTISSSLSSTYAHAIMAKELVEGNGSSSRRIAVIDSRTASLGTGLMLHQIFRDMETGLGYEEVVARAEARVPKTKTYFYLDTLENVIKGGRLDRAKGAIASVLNVKLVMRANEEGAVEVADKVRGKKNAINRLVEKLEDIRGPLDERVLGVAHSNCLEEALELRDRILKKYPFRETFIAEMGPVIGTYAGEGGLIICYN